MPLQNRVTPFGSIIADTARGMFTGNRGILHDPATKTLHPTRRWTSKAWIICLCDFNGRKRDVFGRNGPNGSPGWTNLFFLDEATALAAGHRPCFYCQRERAKEFQDAFSKGLGEMKLKAQEIDALLHSERLDGRKKRVHDIKGALPDGVMLTDGKAAFLRHCDAWQKWTQSGYVPSITDGDVKLLTPPGIVKTFAAGFTPVLHPSATPR